MEYNGLAVRLLGLQQRMD